jgi:hypothetical protein
MTDLRWCSWHNQISDDTVLITVVEVGSGPGVMHYACRHCCATYGLTSADQAESDDSPTGESHPS